MQTIHLGIVEDEPIMLASIKECFERNPGVQIEKACETMEDFLDGFDPSSPINMMLLDINLPGMNGISGIPHLLSRKPDLDIIILTNSDNSDNIFKALQTGAVSYLSKKKVNPSILQEAVYTVHRGGSYMSPGIARQVVAHMAKSSRKSLESKKTDPEQRLTPRQMEIVQGFVENLTYKDLAERMDISLETVRDHVKKIYRKLQVSSKMEVVRKKLDGEI
ncbi:MAG: response regulator transcription factor [Bacteroidota bacterium]